MRIPAMQKNIATAFHGGVKVAFGTDAAVYPHGLNAHEFAVMVHLGLSPLQSIQAATSSAADLLGDPILEAPVELVAPNLLAFAEIAPARVRCYPLTTQVAEKLHTYTRPTCG